MLIVGIYLEINGIPMILCLISVIWNICLNGLVKILFCSIVLVGRRNNIEFFRSLLMLILVLLLVCWRFQEGVSFGCKVFISFHVGMFIIFDSAPESIKKSISRSGG